MKVYIQLTVTNIQYFKIIIYLDRKLQKITCKIRKLTIFLNCFNNIGEVE